MGVSPNQITFLSLLTGLASARLFFQSCFLAGSFLLLLATVIDCCDGMVARATGRSSPTGRIWDGLADSLWVAAIWFGIFFSSRFSYPAAPVFWLMFFASLSMFAHVWAYDGVKNTYLAICEPDFSEKNLTKDQVIQALQQSLKERRYWDAFLYALLTWHAALFGKGAEKNYSLSVELREQARQRLFLPMRLWGFLGEGTHLGLMVAGGLATPFYPDAMLVAFATILIPLNLLFCYAGLSGLNENSALDADGGLDNATLCDSILVYGSNLRIRTNASQDSTLPPSASQRRGASRGGQFEPVLPLSPGPPRR